MRKMYKIISKINYQNNEKFILIWLSLITASLSCDSDFVDKSFDDHILWYESEAEKWDQALQLVMVELVL